MCTGGGWIDRCGKPAARATAMPLQPADHRTEITILIDCAATTVIPLETFKAIDSLKGKSCDRRGVGSREER